MENNKISNIITFSILMPSYNGVKYIEEAIQSVIFQTYPHWELIIVDDVSIDNTIEKIKLFLKDQRIKLFIHEKNKGIGQTLITAIKKSSNIILCILDQDDKLFNNALEIMANAHEKNPEYGLIYSTYWECDSKMQNPRIAKEIGFVDPNQTNINHIKVSHFKTFRKNVYLKTKGINPKLKNCIDSDLIFKLEEITKLKFINKPLYYYRNHEGGFSKKYQFKVYLNQYIAKLDAYSRRLNKNIPNLEMKNLYIEYYYLIFYNIIHFFNFLTRKLRTLLIIDIILIYIYKKFEYSLNKKRAKKSKSFFWLEKFIGYIKF